MSRVQEKAVENEVRTLVGPILEIEGFSLVAVELLNVLGRRTLRLSVESSGGVQVADCSRLSKMLSPVLDADEPVQGAYDLELSSPGMKRPLQLLQDFHRFAGFRAKIRLLGGEDDSRRRYSGQLLPVENGRIRIDVDGEVHELETHRIDCAYLVLELHEYESIARGDWNETPIEPGESHDHQ